VDLFVSSSYSCRILVVVDRKARSLERGGGRNGAMSKAVLRSSVVSVMALVALRYWIGGGRWPRHRALRPSFGASRIFLSPASWRLRDRGRAHAPAPAGVHRRILHGRYRGLCNSDGMNYRFGGMNDLKPSVEGGLSAFLFQRADPFFGTTDAGVAMVENYDVRCLCL
jgi:hypothetical protein